MTARFETTIVVTGHYGSGKTNLALNLAMDVRRAGQSVTIADLDVVNPYFRTADFKETAAQNGISLVASEYAGSNLDMPALSAALDGAFGGDGALIIDVGGDDAGAYALGRYAPRIGAKPYTMLYVVNAYRYLTQKPEEAAELLSQIEAASRLKATHIANCSSLGAQTTPQDVERSLSYAAEVSRLTGRPLAFTAAMRGLVPELECIQELYPVDLYVKAPWENMEERLIYGKESNF